MENIESCYTFENKYLFWTFKILGLLFIIGFIKLVTACLTKSDET